MVPKDDIIVQDSLVPSHGVADYMKKQSPLAVNITKMTVKGTANDFNLTTNLHKPEKALFRKVEIQHIIYL